MFTVIEWPFNQHKFNTFSEAVMFIYKHKSGVKDCCYIENEKTKEVWHYSTNGFVKKQEKLLSLF